MKNLTNYLFVVWSVQLLSCTVQPSGELETPPSVIESSLYYFKGEIISNSVNNVGGIDVWEIQMQNTNASIVSLLWRIEPLTLLQIHGKTGPFEYSLSPGNNLINFSAARTIAMGQVNSKNLLNWILKQNVVNNNSWIYIFEFGSNFETPVSVYIDAINGNILQVD